MEISTAVRKNEPVLCTAAQMELSKHTGTPKKPDTTPQDVVIYTKFKLR